MLVLNSPEVTQETVLRWKPNQKIALVPTMGCLHQGHLSLIRLASKHADKCLVSIFVNPLQFGPHEDFDRYPRTFEEDLETLKNVKVDLLFHPQTHDLYPKGFSTRIKMSGLTEHLCAKTRLGHFDGVATVCLKLFLVTQADFVVFGEKDFQQLRVIEQLVSDLNLPLTVLRHPTVRDEDNMAVSSRNVYLSPDERKSARQIPAALTAARNSAKKNPNATVGFILTVAKEQMPNAPLELEYLQIASERDLQPTDEATPISRIVLPRIFAAARVGKSRLIDNMPLDWDKP